MVYYIFTVIAFFKYIVEDSVGSRYAYFFTYTMLVMALIFIILELIVMTSVAMSRTLPTIIFWEVIIALSIAILFNFLLFFWVKELIEILPPIKRDEETIDDKSKLEISEMQLRKQPSFAKKSGEDKNENVEIVNENSEMKVSLVNSKRV